MLIMIEHAVCTPADSNQFSADNQFLARHMSLKELFNHASVTERLLC